MIARLWRRHRLLLLAFSAVTLLAVVFAVRTAVFAVYWADPAHREEPIAGWMTPRYIVLSWDVPPEVVAATLGLEMDGTGRRITLAEIAAQSGVPVEALAAKLQVAIDRYRQAQ